MVNLRGVGDIGSHHNVGALGQSGEAEALQKKKKEIRHKLKNLSARDARKFLEKEFGRDIDDPVERETIERLSKDIRKNADKLI